jgi:hypothetical protein
MFKFQINLDLHGPRTFLKICHIHEPPPFSLFTTCKKLNVQYLKKSGDTFFWQISPYSPNKDINTVFPKRLHGTPKLNLRDTVIWARILSMD